VGNSNLKDSIAALSPLKVALIRATQVAEGHEKALNHEPGSVVLHEELSGQTNPVVREALEPLQRQSEYASKSSITLKGSEKANSITDLYSVRHDPTNVILQWAAIDR
jgi:hypothetical protein